MYIDDTHYTDMQDYLWADVDLPSFVAALHESECALDPAALYPCSTSDTGPSVYRDANGTWHYRGQARFQRSHFNLKGRGSVTAAYAAEMLEQCLVVAFAKAAIERYERATQAAMSTVQNVLQRVTVDHGKVKYEVYRAMGGHAKAMFPTRHKPTIAERHERQLELWGWKGSDVQKAGL